MQGNNGGFRAETGGEVITCETSNDFDNNGGTVAPYDVFAFEFSLVDAEKSYWGHTLRAQIGTVDEEYSLIDIDPILTTAAGSNSTDVCGEAPKRGDGTASVEGPEGLPSLLVEAAQLRVTGRATEAADLLASALATAESEAEFGPLTGAAARLIAHAEDAEAVRPLEAWARRAAADTEAAPWAERLLLVHAVLRGTTADVERFGQALLRRAGDRTASHKLFAVRALLEQAVRDGREETARQWLATAATLDAAASTDLRRFVDVAFQREGAEPPRVAEAGVLKVDDADAFAARQPEDGLIELAPNPANTHVRVMVSDAAFAAAEEAEVSVFDALGRVVLTPASVGQAQSALFDVGSLPVGTYTVRVSYTAVDGRPATATTRFTVSR
jgi:hypothetical protein